MTAPTRAPKRYASDLTHGLDAIAMRPIGIVHSPYKERYAAPRQPAGEQEAEIHLLAEPDMRQAVQDLDRFSHIWVIYWMHLNQGWNPTVIPPRQPRIRRGVLATRAPHRPNSSALSAVRLVGIEGSVLRICGLDMLAGTPVLYIKPAIP